MNYLDIIKKLESGKMRAATKTENSWQANIQVKEAILEAFKEGKLKQFGEFIDKDTLPPQKFSIEREVRIVPGGSSARAGSYIASGVVIMPPAFINIGAYIDSGSMVDSNALIGSCAQIGKNVHISAGVQIGGVLEPVGLTPVIIENSAFIGAGAIIVEGIQIGANAIIAAGVTLSKGTYVYDLVNQKDLGKGANIPENAVVIPGSRPIKNQWAQGQGLNISCAIIVKYNNDNSKSSLELEKHLR